MIQAAEEGINENSRVSMDVMCFNGEDYDTDMILDSFTWDPGKVLKI